MTDEQLKLADDLPTILDGWAKAYRDSPEHRFPSDPHAEFFPLDLENAAKALRAATRPAPTEAFQPFADFMSSPMFEKLSDETRLTAGSPMARRQLTVGDLRKLAAALSVGEAVGVMEWRCFHCDETFTDPAAAKDHFGYDMLAEPGCKLNEIEGGLLGILRRQEERLDAYHREDTASYREFYALGADHYQALRREEEKGYARGLADGQALPALPSEAIGREDGEFALGRLQSAVKDIDISAFNAAKWRIRKAIAVLQSVRIAPSEPEASQNGEVSRLPETSSDVKQITEAIGREWQPIETAPKDRFIFLYCPEDESRWLAKWQGGEWYGIDCEDGILRTGHSFGDPDFVTGWFVSHWMPLPAGPSVTRPTRGGAAS